VCSCLHFGSPPPPLQFVFCPDRSPSWLVAYSLRPLADRGPPTSIPSYSPPLSEEVRLICRSLRPFPLLRRSSVIASPHTLGPRENVAFPLCSDFPHQSSYLSFPFSRPSLPESLLPRSFFLAVAMFDPTHLFPPVTTHRFCNPSRCVNERPRDFPIALIYLTMALSVHDFLYIFRSRRQRIA